MQLHREDKIELRIEKNEKTYVMLIPAGSQLEDAKDVALGFAQVLIKSFEENKKEESENTKGNE